MEQLRLLLCREGRLSLAEPSSPGDALESIKGAERAWLDLTIEEASEAGWLLKLGVPDTALSRALDGRPPNFSFTEGWCLLKLPASTEARILIHRGLSLIFNERLAVSLHPKDVRQPVEEMEEASPRFTSNAAYVAYQLADRVLDDFDDVIERLDAELARLEDEVVEGSGEKELLRKILGRKRRLLMLSRGLWTLKDAVHSLRRASPPFIDDELDSRLTQLCEEADRQIEMVETYRIMASDVINMYATTLSTKLNLSVKDLTVAMLYLTVIATVIGFPNTVATIFGVPTLAEAIETHWILMLLVGSAVVPILWLKSFWNVYKQKSY
ncbi:MAG: hypothetical protein DRJ69_06235 [Thermoprotei archaeon]|nr:MAG: hypothetical protein DRJ69_06235 [Thermoprotei archaeon]